MSRREKDQATQFCQQGEAFLRKKEYDSAVRRFMMAVKLNPERTKYADLQNEAISESQNSHVEMAEKAIENKDLGSAKDHLEKAQSFKPHLQSKVRLSIVENQIAEFEKKALAADKDIEKKLYDRALNSYKELLKEWPTNEAFKRQIAAIHKHVEDKETGRADYLLRTDFRWHEAKEAARKLLESYPQSTRLKEILAESQKRLSAHESAKQGETCFAEGNYDKALSLFSETMTLFPAYPKIEDMKKSATLKVCESHRIKAKESIASCNYAAAINSYRTISSTDPKDKESKTKIRELKRKYAKEVVADSIRASKKGLPGTSVSRSIKALGLDPANRIARATFSAAKEQIINKSIRRIFVNTFKNESSIEQIPAIFQNHINSTIPAFKAPFIKIVSRDNKGDIEVTGTIKEAGIYERRDETTSSVNYKSGTQTIQNPDYQAAVLKYNQALANLNQAQRQNTVAQQQDKIVAAASMFALTMNQNAFEAAKRNLSQTPQTVVKDIISNYQFPVFKVTRRGILSVEITFFDKSRGVTILNKTITKEETYSDIEVIADPSKGIPGDPLILPLNSEIFATLTVRSIEDLNALLKNLIDTEYFKIIPSEKELTDGNENNAIERALGAFYATIGGNENLFPDYVMKYLSRKTDLASDELTAILKRY
jgi:tetratricopeptide (TPR) repeat protein